MMNEREPCSLNANGPAAPPFDKWHIAAVASKLVSEEVDRRLAEEPGRVPRLRPDKWKSGEIGWLIDAAGEPRDVASAVERLRAGPFEATDTQIIVRDLVDQARLKTLRELSSRSKAGVRSR